MRTKFILIFAILITTTSLYGGIPEIESLGENERISIQLTYSEPLIVIFLFIFENKSVTIFKNAKQVGKIAISDGEAARIDHFLYRVWRGKKARKSDMGVPAYRITHEQSGRKSGEWSYSSYELKKPSKPSLSLRELRERVGE